MMNRTNIHTFHHYLRRAAFWVDNGFMFIGSVRCRLELLLLFEECADVCGYFYGRRAMWMGVRRKRRMTRMGLILVASPTKLAFV